ncbi:hypothetical protein CPB86DRAFT_766087 [Serendipita vermifera]|nr:hypothetical protein CPB86DRAFT_766087 [Serendipita vermifera]
MTLATLATSMNRARRPPPINPDANPNPIQQPPHSAGVPLQGLRSRLNPNQIPSTAAKFYEDEERWTKESYLTVGDQPVPQSACEYHAIDQGNSTPRFLRPTIYAVPSSSELQQSTHVPFGIHITPLAQQPPEEEPVPCVDFGDEGPPRCTSDACRAYINPWCTWEGGGLRWICNLCGTINDAPIQYSSPDNPKLELRKGTVDFLVPAAYWPLNPPKRLIHSFVPVTTDSGVPSTSTSTSTNTKPVEKSTRKPGPMNYVFALDTSLEAVQTGLLSSACTIIMEMLYGSSFNVQEGQEEEVPARPIWWNPESKLTVITYDKEVCFYDFVPGQDHPSIIVVADVDEVFAPMPPSSTLFVDPSEARGSLSALLTNLPVRNANTVRAQAAMGSAIAASTALLSSVGGQVVLFGSCLPKIGYGLLTEQDNERSLYNTENEPTLFKPRVEKWKEMAEECVDYGVGVTMVLAPSRWTDLGTIGIVPKLTGGDIFFHPKFDPERDYPIMHSQIRRLLNREAGYQATLRLRCTPGIQVKAHYGNFLERSTTDVDLATIDADKSIYVSLDYTSALDDFSSLTLDTITSFISQKEKSIHSPPAKQSLGTLKQAYFQSALLYTTTSGERRVRVCNLSVPVVSLAGNVFRYGDYEGVIGALTKTALLQMSKKPLREIRDILTAQSAELLLHYRRYCAAAAAASELILPEGFTLLPVYTNCILKCKPLKATPVMSDVRNIHAHNLSSKSITELIRYLYPRLYQLHDNPETMGTYNETTGRIEMPILIRSNYRWMQGQGIYLIDDGDVMFLWLGAEVHEEYWQDLFGVSNAHELPGSIRHLPELDNSFSTRVRAVIAHLESQNGIARRFIVVRQNLDALEIDFSNMLIEDTNNGGMSYDEYMMYLHRLIQASMDNGYSAVTVGHSNSRKIPW